MAGEPLSNGHQVAIGTDLTGDQQITITDAMGALRAWGVQDAVSGRTLLWIDNAADTWKAVVDRAEIPPASGTLTLAGFAPGQVCRIEWWDPYTTASEAAKMTLATADADGTIAVTVGELTRDVAVKVMVHGAYRTYAYRIYMPLATRAGL